MLRFRNPAALGRVALAGGVLLAATWSAVLLNRTPDFLPGIDVVVVMVALAAAIVIAHPEARAFPRASTVAAGIALAALLIGPSAYAVGTMNTSYSGGDPAAVISASTQRGPGGFGGGPQGGAATGNQALYDYLTANRGTAAWIVAVQGSDQAAQIELATGQPVMAMGGFSGSDPAPTLDQLKALVAEGRLRYVIVGGGTGGSGGPGGRGASTGVTSWITANGTLVTDVGGVSLYDLSGAA
jgi:4-amino-4-deoxy-L-arabinose transferase-like glycosyltransferase